MKRHVKSAGAALNVTHFPSHPSLTSDLPLSPLRPPFILNRARHPPQFWRRNRGLELAQPARPSRPERPCLGLLPPPDLSGPSNRQPFHFHSSWSIRGQISTLLAARLGWGTWQTAKRTVHSSNCMGMILEVPAKTELKFGFCRTPLSPVNLNLLNMNFFSLSSVHSHFTPVPSRSAHKSLFKT